MDHPGLKLQKPAHLPRFFGLEQNLRKEPPAYTNVSVMGPGSVAMLLVTGECSVWCTLRVFSLRLLLHDSDSCRHLFPSTKHVVAEGQSVGSWCGVLLPTEHVREASADAAPGLPVDEAPFDGLAEPTKCCEHAVCGW